MGAEISSKRTPPKVGVKFFTKAIISFGSEAEIHNGQASIPANSLNSIAFPSITGIAAFGPISPSPNTAEPSETTATIFARFVYLLPRETSRAISKHTPATPGVYAVERSKSEETGTLEFIEILPLYLACNSNANFT